LASISRSRSCTSTDTTLPHDTDTMGVDMNSTRRSVRKRRPVRSDPSLARNAEATK